jgi:hypothetical protein
MCVWYGMSLSLGQKRIVLPQGRDCIGSPRRMKSMFLLLVWMKRKRKRLTCAQIIISSIRRLVNYYIYRDSGTCPPYLDTRSFFTRNAEPRPHNREQSHLLNFKDIKHFVVGTRANLATNIPQPTVSQILVRFALVEFSSSRSSSNSSNSSNSCSPSFFSIS